ncbi:hypothetical protein D9M72_417060 [compost metagenome]
MPGDQRQHLAGQVPFLADAVEHIAAQRRVVAQLRIARSHRQVGLGQHHVHVGQQRGEERPGLDHAAQRGHGQLARLVVRRSVQQRLDRAAEAVPARQQQPALAPREAPRDCPQVFDAAVLLVHQLARGRARTQVQVGDLGDRRGGEEVVLETRSLVHQVAVGREGAVRQLLHHRLEHVEVPGRVLLRQQRRFQRGRDHRFQVAPADLGVGELAVDDLALFGEADLAVHGARRLRQDGIVGRAATAADGAAAAVEQAQLDLALLEQLHQCQLGLVQLPGGSQEAAVLV